MSQQGVDFSKKISKKTVQKSIIKYKRAKQVSNFLMCGANDVVEHYGERIEIMHGCPFEG